MTPRRSPGRVRPLRRLEERLTVEATPHGDGPARARLVLTAPSLSKRSPNSLALRVLARNYPSSSVAFGPSLPVFLSMLVWLLRVRRPVLFDNEYLCWFRMRPCGARLPAHERWYRGFFSPSSLKNPSLGKAAGVNGCREHRRKIVATLSPPRGGIVANHASGDLATQKNALVFHADNLPVRRFRCCQMCQITLERYLCGEAGPPRLSFPFLVFCARPWAFTAGTTVRCNRNEEPTP